MKIRYILATIFFVALATFIGCGGDSGGDGDTQSSSKGASFDFQLSGIHYGKSSADNDNSKGILSKVISKLSSSDTDVYEGELKARNLETGVTEVYDWYCYVDKQTFAMTSAKSLVLSPGDYEFSMLLNFGIRQYVATATYTIRDGEAVSIPFNVDPVLGDIILSVDDVTSVPAFKFKYKSSELLAYLNPRVSFGLDSQASSIIDINKNTGMNGVYININSGNHDVKIDFFDGNMHIGKSTQYPATVNIAPNQDINMDIEPLSSEVIFSYASDDNNLSVTINVPSEIVDEVGGLENLKTIVKYTYTNNVGEKNVTVTADETNSTYQAVVPFGITNSDTNLTLSFEFIDKRDDYVVSVINIDNMSILDINQTISKSINVIRRVYISGNLLATVGINVFDESHFPLSGAKIYVGSRLVGLTGSGLFGTDGYLKTNIKAGDATITAIKDNLGAQKTVTLSPLSVTNIDLIIGDNNVSVPISDGNDTVGSTGYMVNVCDEFPGSFSGQICNSAWRLVGVRKGVVHTIPSNPVNKITNGDDEAYLNDAIYQDIIADAKEFMLLRTVDKKWASVDLDYVRNNSDKYCSATSPGIGNHILTTLSVKTLIHSESRGCTGSGQDYTYLLSTAIYLYDTSHMDAVTYSNMSKTAHSYANTFDKAWLLVR
jgi:hypothetical protein